MRSTSKKAPGKRISMKQWEQIIQEALNDAPAELREWVCRIAKQQGLSPDLYVYNVLCQVASNPARRAAVEQAAIRRAARNYQ